MRGGVGWASRTEGGVGWASRTEGGTLFRALNDLPPQIVKPLSTGNVPKSQKTFSPIGNSWFQGLFAKAWMVPSVRSKTAQKRPEMSCPPQLWSRYQLEMSQKPRTHSPTLVTVDYRAYLQKLDRSPYLQFLWCFCEGYEWLGERMFMNFYFTYCHFTNLKKILCRKPNTIINNF